MKKTTSKVAHMQHKSHFLFHKNVSLRDFYVLTLSIANPKCASNKLHNPPNHSVATVPSGFSGNLDNSPTTDDCATIRSATNVEDDNCSRNYASICEINVVQSSIFNIDYESLPITGSFWN